MKGSEKVIECLNEVLFLEFGVINQYWLYYCFLVDWGFVCLVKKECEELIEEMQYVDKLIDCIIFFEGYLNMQKVVLLRIGQNVKEVLECDFVGEYDVCVFYKKFCDICWDEGDYVFMVIFEELLKDEEGYIDFLEIQFEFLECIGEECYGMLNVVLVDEVE